MVELNNHKHDLDLTEKKLLRKKTKFCQRKKKKNKGKVNCIWHGNYLHITFGTMGLACLLLYILLNVYKRLARSSINLTEFWNVNNHYYISSLFSFLLKKLNVTLIWQWFRRTRWTRYWCIRKVLLRLPSKTSLRQISRKKRYYCTPQ